MSEGLGRKLTVAVVGDGDLPPGDRRLELARDCGRLLADSGYVVLTGGRAVHAAPGGASRMKNLATAVALALSLAGCSSSGSRLARADIDARELPDLAPEASRDDTIVLPDVPTIEVPDKLSADTAPDAEAEATAPQCQPGEGCFMDQCTQNSQCQSGWCVEDKGEGVCSQECQEECPAGWTCKQVAGTDPDLVYVCVSGYANLCKPCQTNADCHSVGGADDACVDYGSDGDFCGGPCQQDKDCPWGFSCQDVQTVEGALLTQCVSDTGTCPCTAKSIAVAATTACARTNELGTCAGKRTCTQEGLSNCDAATPAEESCDGLDDDCDGDTDEPGLVEGKFVELCDDGNECTEDACKAADGCLHLPLDGDECKDGDPCTVADHCVLGGCLGTPVECKDDNPCTDDTCDQTGGCVFVNNDESCNDGNPCTIADTCQDGTCSGVTLPCDCQVDADCVALEDGDLCNGTLFCDTAMVPFQCAVAAGSVVECPAPLPGPDAPCQKSHCVPETGACEVVPDSDGFLCEDADLCTVGDKCAQGQCLSGFPVNCADDNPCTEDQCLPEAGCTHVNMPASCSDADPCTVGDYCDAGVCMSGELQSCDDGNPCTDDSCSLAGLCLHSPNQSGCDDENACTSGDQCKLGKCVALQSVECDDGNLCTTDACDPASGCVYNLNQVPCDDKDVCTAGDHCDKGVCTGGSPIACEDGDPCTDDSCNPAKGCTHTDNAAACDDADPCTLNDVCSAGLCAGVPKLCNDGNECTNDACGPDGTCESSAVANGTACGPGPQWICVSGQCECQPACAGAECGPDGCGGHCGQCPDKEFCYVGRCYLPMTLSDTGQAKCYDQTSETACPADGQPFFGQDAQHVGIPPSFHDNGDGTVTDLVTGLEWAKCTAGQTVGSCSGTSVAMLYADAVAWCADNQDGLPGDGWRLPNVFELVGIMHNQSLGVWKDSALGGIGNNYNWAAPAGVSPYSCPISFSTGSSGCGGYNAYFMAHVRCVRGEERAAGDFEDGPAGTVLDASTGLVWEKDANPAKRTWQEGLAYCEALELAGQSDWRLPNMKELGTLRDCFSADKSPILPAFEGPEGNYWSGTTMSSLVDGYALHKGSGLGSYGDSKPSGFYVRCVRSDCQPFCGDQQCGDDGCGGSCGTCADGGVCQEGTCVYEVTVLDDPFNDASINPATWTVTGIKWGVGGYSFQESNDVLALTATVGSTGNTYGGTAWAVTVMNFKTGKNYRIVFRWKYTVAAGSLNDGLIEIAQGAPNVNQGGLFDHNIYTETADRRILRTQTTNSAFDLWSICLNGAAQTASIYANQDCSGAPQKTADLKGLQAWYLRFLVCTATSAGFPANSVTMELDSVKALQVP